METTERGAVPDPIAAVLALDALGSLDRASLDGLEHELVVLQIASGDMLMRQGEPGDTAYVLVHGWLQVTVRQPDRTQIEVDELHAPAIVGELALITGQPRSATITALGPSSLVGCRGWHWSGSAPAIPRR